MKHLRLQEVSFYVYLAAMNGNREHDVGVGQERVVFIPETHTQRLILVAFLVVITLLPKYADTNQVLFFFVSASKMRSGKKSKTPAVYLQRLVYRKFH